MNRKQRNESKKYTVALYDCNQSFGGPEEGGWWYNTGHFISLEATFFNQDKAYSYMRDLNAYCERANKGKYPIDSVMCDGVVQARVHQGEAPAYFPQHRPYYC